MDEHVILVGGPEDGRKLLIKEQHDVVHVDVRRRGSDPGQPSRRRQRRPEKAAYRRTARGVGTGLIPRRYVYDHKGD